MNFGWGILIGILAGTFAGLAAVLAGVAVTMFLETRSDRVAKKTLVP